MNDATQDILNKHIQFHIRAADLLPRIQQEKPNSTMPYGILIEMHKEMAKELVAIKTEIENV